MEDGALGSRSGNLLSEGHCGYSLAVSDSSKENDNICFVGIVE